MKTGLYLLEFGTQRFGGVAVINNGLVLGGDSSFTYEGSYSYDESKNQLLASVRITRFTNNTGSFLGADDAIVGIVASVNGPTITGQAQYRGQTFPVALTLKYAA